ncbi:hypothetical protein LUZ60_015272 [Juncus effusus]|nr:hypothetical protein LUZ60_015272 [Juncus effusus]
MKKPYTTKVLANYFLSFIFPLSLLLCIIFFSQSFHQPLVSTFTFYSYSKNTSHSSKSDSCAGRYVYVYDLPSRFNTDILLDCKNLSSWHDMCRLTSNYGLGPELKKAGSILPESGWFETNMWTLEIIFHNRVKQYDCLTNDYSISNAVYIPYYVGLDIVRYLWKHDLSAMDILTNELLHWLKSRPEWTARGGKDHFLVSGRSAWDIRRDETGEWGGKLLALPETKNITFLLIEATIWDNNQIAIPYPTYFHPSEKSQVVLWQEKLRSIKRPFLFSLAGARRPNRIPSTRDLVIDQCAHASLCEFFECGTGDRDCHSQSNVIKLFMNSIFCLQPMGDGLTRSATFDGIMAGCIPVFFHPSSAYNQYVWYFPRNFNKYSVYIPEDAVREGRVKIQDVLLGYSEEQIREMREEVIRMIPTVTFNDPRYKLESVRDAFDVAIDGVLERINENS